MSSSALLPSHARVLRRSVDTVQIGPVRGDGLVLRGLSPHDVKLLLDIGAGLDLARLRRRAGPEGLQRLEGLLAELRARGVVPETTGPSGASSATSRPGPTGASQADGDVRAAAYGPGTNGASVIAARAERHVLVHGTGDLAQLVARALSEGGVGRLTTGDAGADLHDLALRAGEDAPPDLVVFVGSGIVPASRAEPWRRRGVAHLPVVVDGPRLEVGPLVTSHGPCLRCLDLHRGDRDPQWPAVVEQLDDRPGVPPRRVDGESALRHLAAGFVSTFVHAHLDGRCDLAPGLVVEARLPQPSVVHRQWFAHPRCRCEGSRVTMQG